MRGARRPVTPALLLWRVEGHPLPLHLVDNSLGALVALGRELGGLAGQQFINQSIQLGRVNDALIRALATMAVSNNDDKLRDLLAQSGITINPTTGAPEREAAPAAAAPTATGR